MNTFKQVAMNKLLKEAYQLGVTCCAKKIFSNFSAEELNEKNANKIHTICLEAHEDTSVIDLIWPTNEIT